MTLSTRTAGLIAVICLAGAVATLTVSSAETRERNPATLLTLVLHQKEDQSVDAFKKQLEDNGFREAFPPDGVEVESWSGVLGVGHVITLRLPTYKVPEVKNVVEARQWKDIEPKLYSSYDFEPMWKEMGGKTNTEHLDPDHYQVSAHRMLIAP